MRHLLVLCIFISLLIVIPGAVLISSAPTSTGTATHSMEVIPYATTTNNTSRPWWDVAWNDVTGIIGTAGSDSAYWLSLGLTGTYNAITSNIGNFFGGFVLNAVETVLEDALGAILSLFELAAAEISAIFGTFILDLEAIAIEPALGVFGPIIALVIILAICVFAIVIVRLVLDVA